MELLMLNQNNSRFRWENIKSNPPKINYTFDRGVTLNGKIQKKTDPNSKYKISLISLKDNLFDETPIDKNSNFKFENFFAQDSTVFVLQMVNEKNMSIVTKIEAGVSPGQTIFTSPLQFDKIVCPAEKNTSDGFSFVQPKLENNIINLSGVTIKSKTNVFAHKEQASMSANAFVYKIKDGDYGKVLDFIGRNGYHTGVDPENNNVYIKSSKNSYLGDSASSPAVYLENELLFDYNLLFNLNLNDVDEIYIDQSGASDTTISGTGTIKIFLKNKDLKKNYFRIKYTSFIVTNGFAQNMVFKNSQFETQNEFGYFGTLNWSPNITIKDNPNYEIKFPKGNQKVVQVLLEGFSEDGQLISEIKKVSL
jgi:hypothetical protein